MKFYSIPFLFVFFLANTSFASSIPDIPEDEIIAITSTLEAEYPELRPATLNSRVTKSFLRFLLVTLFTAQNLNVVADFNATEGILIGAIAGTGSGVLQFYNHMVQGFLANAKIAKWLALKFKLPPGGLKSRLMNHLQQILNGYTLDLVYMVYTNLGIYLVAPQTFPDAKSFLVKTLGLSLLGMLSQTIAEASYAKQVGQAKRAFPMQATEIQDRSDYVVAAWSIIASGLSVGAVLDVWYATPVLWGMAGLGVGNYLYALKQSAQEPKAKKTCWSSFLAPWLMR